MNEVDVVLRLIRDELHSAMKQHNPMNSPHEAIGVIREEYKELEDEIFEKIQSKQMMKYEAVQLAAMCVRFILDCKLL